MTSKPPAKAPSATRRAGHARTRRASHLAITPVLAPPRLPGGPRRRHAPPSGPHPRIGPNTKPKWATSPAAHRQCKSRYSDILSMNTNTRPRPPIRPPAQRKLPIIPMPGHPALSLAKREPVAPAGFPVRQRLDNTTIPASVACADCIPGNEVNASIRHHRHRFAWTIPASPALVLVNSQHPTSR